MELWGWTPPAGCSLPRATRPAYLSARVPMPGSLASTLHRKSSKSHTFSRNKAASDCAFSLVATSCSLLLLSMLVRSTASRGCRGDLVPVCVHRRGARYKPSPQCWSARVQDMLPTPLQVDREVTVRTERGRELPRAGFRPARPGCIYRKPASGIGAVDQVGSNRGGPWAPAPCPTTQAHYGDIPRTEKEAPDFWS